MKYPHLFSPLRLGPREVPNRIVVSAHHNNFDINGLWSERTVKYFEARAAGGAGLIIAGAIRVHPRNPESICWPRSDWAFAAGQVEMFRKGVAAVKAHGSVFIAQLAHGGRQFWDSREDFEPLLAPSPIPCPVISEVPKEMDDEDFDDVLAAFVEAAEVCMDGGFDGIEVHAAYGYLLSSFLSAATNRRSDRYGGGLQQRMSFPLEVLRGVRSVIGSDKVLGVRMIADEYVDSGITPHDAAVMAASFEASGLVDYLSIVSGTYASGVAFDPPMYAEAGYDVHLAARVKDAVDLPVMVAGRLKDPTMADQIIASGQADLVAMTRATICDPDLPRLAEAGREDEIRWCIGCNQRCIGNLEHHLPIGCFQNPVSGREFDPFWAELRPAPVPKRVVVVGAGPAGCEAARVLAERGHQVVLCDEGDAVGGQVRIIELASGRDEWQDVYRYFSNRLSDLGVDVRLGVRVGMDDVLAERPDAVVVATGSSPRTSPWEHLPALEGLERAVDVRSALDGSCDVGDRVVVYAGDNHLQGLTCADTLLDRGRSVHVVVPAEAPGALAEQHNVHVVVTRMSAKGLGGLHTLSAVTRVIDGEAHCVELASGGAFTLDCDTLVSSFGGIADAGLYGELKGRVPQLHRVGDCVAPRTADSAIFEGARVGRLI